MALLFDEWVDSLKVGDLIDVFYIDCTWHTAIIELINKSSFSVNKFIGYRIDGLVEPAGCLATVSNIAPYGSHTMKRKTAGKVYKRPMAKQKICQNLAAASISKTKKKPPVMMVIDEEEFEETEGKKDKKAGKKKLELPEYYDFYSKLKAGDFCEVLILNEDLEYHWRVVQVTKVYIRGIGYVSNGGCSGNMYYKAASSIAPVGTNTRGIDENISCN